MKFIKNNIFTMFALALVFTIAMVDNASANSVMDIAKLKALAVFKNVKTIVFVVGGFGLVALAFQAIFGKVKWPWFAGLALGLAILAAAGSIVNYATGDSTVGEFGDTFNSSTM